jgi:hypothetical protein
MRSNSETGLKEMVFFKTKILRCLHCYAIFSTFLFYIKIINISSKVNQMATLKQQGVYWDALDNIETV